jgi:hypothetical protein
MRDIAKSILEKKVLQIKFRNFSGKVLSMECREKTISLKS